MIEFMAHLIDKSALVAEIERRINAYQKNFDKSDNKIARLSTDGRIAGLKGLLSFINTLKVKEVDLDKEISDNWETGYLLGIGFEQYADIAKHFFELGMQQSKNHNNNEE